MRLAALLLTASLVAAGCVGSGGDASSDPGDPTTSLPTTTLPTTTTPTTSPAEAGCPAPVGGRPADGAPYAVGRDAVDYVDVSRRTEPGPGTGGVATAGRRLPTVVLYPASGTPDGTVVDGAEPAPGRFPLVVYSHGVASSGLERHDALSRWAAAGYVVVAPTFPLSSQPRVDITDLPNQPADVVFVTRSVQAALQDPRHPLHDRVLGGCLALAGHSLGGATTMAAAFDPCCDSLAPDAVIDVAGVAVNLTPEFSFGDAAPIPTLIVHGELDATVPFAQSQQAFSELPGPRWFLSFPAGAHSSMFEPPEVDLFTASVVAFLDAQLKGATGALDSLPRLVEASGSAQLSVAGT